MDVLNNASRRSSDSSAHKNNIATQQTVSGSRFKTTLVNEDLLEPSSTIDSKANNNMTIDISASDGTVPLVTKAKNTIVKPGFAITDK